MHLIANGIDGTTGDYLVPPLTFEDVLPVLARDGRGAPAPPIGPVRRLAAGRDPKVIGQAGWGVVFAPGVTPAIRQALEPLLTLRHRQVSELDPQLYRELDSSAPPGQGETKRRFLARHRSGPGPVDPRKVPYYLLLVGDPTELPFELQYQLGIQHAVGRLWLDTPDDYRRYADTVVAAESGNLVLPRQAAVFAPANPGDRPTQLASAKLAEPLVSWLGREQPDWAVTAHLGDEARKSVLKGWLDAPDRSSAFLLTASHGLGFPKEHRLQATHQGALVCQEWPGPRHAVEVEHYVAAGDLATVGGCRGMIAFHFACFSAGTPPRDDFDRERELAVKPQLALLPRKLLGQGGALAVVGHVDRAWAYSFLWPRCGQQLAVFEDALHRLFTGGPVGWAFSGFGERAAELGFDLLEELESLDFGRKPSEVVGAWTAFRDARNTLLLGDPAVRLAVALLIS